MSYSDIKGGYSGEGNINADPLFVQAGAGNYHLQAGSPCIDAGTNEEMPLTDMDGVARPQDGDNDDEYIGTFFTFSSALVLDQNLDY